MSSLDTRPAEKHSVEEAITAAGRSRAASLAAPSGILTVNGVALKHKDGRCNVVSEPKFEGIPIGAIALLDIANSSDFAANVFNQIPVPVYAIVLMALGGTFALIMSGVAFVDARRSWRNIGLLKKERQELLARERRSDSDSEKGVEMVPDATLLSLNRRDIRTEFFERCGMETTMGVAAFLVCIGTFMAIGGADPKVFEASNLLSGYIGNAPTAAYGLINTLWAIIAWHRAKKQRTAALLLLGDRPARDALQRRTKVIERHAILSGITCLVSGALGLLTPMYWYPYPVLLVCGALFVHTTWVFRHRVAYVRPLMAHNTQALNQNDIADELDSLLFIQASYKREGTFLSKACFGTTFANSFTVNFASLMAYGLFEEFVKLVLSDEKLGRKLLAAWTKDVEHLTPRDFLMVSKELHPRLNEHCKNCMSKSGPKQLSVRIRFLLEALGTCLITSGGKPSERTLTERTLTEETVVSKPQ